VDLRNRNQNLVVKIQCILAANLGFSQIRG
jgi:hypothetical protein